MQASDVMTTNVITAQPDDGVQAISQQLLKYRISAVPVVDADGHVLGIVSEGDLMRRAESDTDSRHSWWLEAVLSAHDRAEEYIKTHGRKAGDVMTRNVVIVEKDTPVREIAKLLETHHIKRVPVTSDKRLVGIVSRANLLHGLAAKGVGSTDSQPSNDQTIRQKLIQALSNEAGLDAPSINVIVNDGAVQLWGLVDSPAEKKAAQIAAENTPGVTFVENNLGQAPAWALAY